MKMKLKLAERFVLLGLLPKEGNFATLKVVRQLKESLSLTEDEIKHYEVKQVAKENGDVQLTWNTEKAKTDKEFEFGEFSVDMLKAKLRKLEEDSKLEEKHFTVYEKFVENKEDGK